MKKSILFLAMLLCSLAASATIVNCSPNSNAISWWMTQGDTLVFADGEYTEDYSIDFNQAGVVLMAAEGAKPVIKNSSYFKIHATTTFIGITFDGQNTSNYALTTRGEATKDLILTDCEFKNFVQYNIEIKENTTLTTLNIENCVFDGTNTTPDAIYGKGIVSQTTIQGSEFKNYTEYCIYANDYYGARYDNLTINNCLFHDCAYSAVFLANAKDGLEKQSCSDFTLTNSTIYNVGAASTTSRGVVELRTNSNISSDQKVLIDHVTLYNFASNNNAWSGGFYIGNSANTTISNCIAMNPEDKKTLYANPYHAYTGAEITNSLYFNCDYNAEHGATTTDLLKADPMFVDAANADFMLYAESPAVGMGDPRWGVKAGLQPGAKVLSKAVAAAAAGATITLGDGIYEESSSFSFDKEGLTIVAAEGTNPVVKSTNQYLEMAIAASTTFKGITFDGDNTAQTAFKIDENTAKDIKFIGCEFKNFSSYCITLTSDGHVDELMIDECLFHDCGAAVYMRDNQLTDAHTCTSFKMTNSTAYNFSDALYKSHYESELYVAAIEIAPTIVAEEYNEVLIDHVTLYNVETNLYEGGFKVGANSNATISNCIAMDPEQRWGKLYRAGTGATITNSLYFNAEPVTEGATLTEFNNADPMFVDAANGNFQLFKNSPAVGTGTADSNLGDPRWGVSNNYKGVKISIEPGQAKLNSAVAYSVNAGDTIVLTDGIYEEPWTFNLDKESLVIMAAENAKPIIKLTNEATVLNIQATTTFNGITFDAGNVANYILATTEATSGTLTITNCEFKNWAYWAISNKSETAASIEAVIIDNCLFHDGAEAAIYFSQNAPEGKHACNYFSLTNSTIYNVKSTKYAGIVHVSSNAEATGMQNKVIIDHVTMYNLDGGDLGIIAVRKSSDLTISNTIIANPAAGEKASYVYGGVAEKVIYFNVSQDGDLTYTYCLTDDPLFVDAANANFTLQATSPAIGAGTDGSNLGDPRWGVAEPSFITLTTGNNDDVIAANIGKTVNVIIERSFTANDGYYTLCVPFNMDPSVIGKAYSLGDIKKHVSGEGIDIDLVEEKYMLSAGVPYLVLPKANMSELVVENVTIQSDIASGQNVTNEERTMQIFFEGFYSAPGRTTNGTTEYYVGNNGYLYNGEVEIRGLSGLFTITDWEGNPLNVRARVVTREDEATGFENITNGENTTIKVIENGQLIIIRNGEKFNAQGVRL